MLGEDVNMTDCGLRILDEQVLLLALMDRHCTKEWKDWKKNGRRMEGERGLAENMKK